jgi:MraZ protein
VSAFIGAHSCKVDDKGRINIPASFRRFLGDEERETFVVTRGFENCLTLYAPAGWKNFQAKLNGLPPGKKKRQVIRFFSSNSATLHLDKQGRVGIPRDFLADYGIEREVLLVGTLESIEVWNPQAYESQMKGAGEALGEIEHLL